MINNIFPCAAQTNRDSIYTIDANLKELITDISSKKIIALGESTHGTKEFTLVRADIVKSLVTQFGFNTFILEADYMPCMAINEFILTGKGDPETLLLNVRLWPWIHQDFLELIIWMKDYNQLHPSEKVQFFGMDSQYSKIYATKEIMFQKYPEKAQAIFDIVEGQEKRNKKIKMLRALSEQTTSISFAIDLEWQYFILCQINKLAQLPPKDYNARDENMARMVELIQLKQGVDTKMMIWSHNEHINKKGSSLQDRTGMGHYLSVNHPDDFVSIAMDFKEGSFMAINFEDKSVHKPESFHLKPFETTFASGLNFKNKDINIIDCKDIDKEVLNAIGAIYVHAPKKGDNYYTKIKGNKSFDYLIIIEKSTPIRILLTYGFK
ncbi:MAG: erythromycin esterase family protein [Saprospiraceae bacterium]|nr:erythromycin esterase family protein [Saprospiraceae bacterium]MBP6568722.1 erythromycin esterase family protein [Saprospiraceae bacterium]